MTIIRFLARLLRTYGAPRHAVNTKTDTAVRSRQAATYEHPCVTRTMSRGKTIYSRVYWSHLEAVQAARKQKEQKRSSYAIS